MVDIANRIEIALISPLAFGVALALVVALVARANRSSLREVASDSDRLWRILARMGAALTALSLLWVSLFDNWFQLIAEPFRLTRRWESQRTVFDPVATEVRLVTGVLLGLLVIVGAALFARHVGGYLAQVAFLIVGTATWLPLFIVQQRAEVMVIDGVSASEHWAAFAGVGAFWILSTVLGIAIVCSSLMTCLMLVAPLVTLLLDLTGLRHPRTTREADPFFTVVQSHARDHEEVSLKDLWKPIRQPS